MAELEESVTFLLEGSVDYEFRTTVAKQFHSAEDFSAIGQWLQRLSPQNKAKRFFIQPFVDRDTVLFAGFSAPQEETLTQYLEALTPYVVSAEVRG